MVEGWIGKLAEFGVPYNEGPSLVTTLSDPVKVRSWQIAGLPKVNIFQVQRKTVHGILRSEHLKERLLENWQCMSMLFAGQLKCRERCYSTILQTVATLY